MLPPASGRPTSGLIRELLRDLAHSSAQRRAPLPLRTFSSTHPASLPLPPPRPSPSLLPSSFSSLPSPPLSRTLTTARDLSSLRTAASSPASTPADKLALLSALSFHSSSRPDDLSLRAELVALYEDLTAFWSSAPGRDAEAVKNDQAFQAYLKALASCAGAGGDGKETAQMFEKLVTARGRREELLKLVSSSSPSSTAAAPSPASPATPAKSSSTPAFSPPALISGLFTSLRGGGKGSEAKVQSVGSFGSWASASSVSASAKSGEGPEPIRVIVEEAKSPLVWRVLKFVLTTALYSFLLLSLLSLLIDSSGLLRAGSQSSQFTAAAAPDPSDPSRRGTTFKDVHGIEEAKHELFEIVEFLKDPERFEKLGGKLPRGVLLTGPPGTGKTLLARAIAGEAGVPFFSATGSEFDEMFVGVGAKRVRELFAAARKAGPAIVFIDELDAVGGKRSAREQSMHRQTMNQLLTEMDGFSGGEGVIVIGATNFPESLDRALVRPGRFDRHVVVPLPDVRGRMEILKHHLRNIVYDRAKVDLSLLARGTIGFSGADLQALVNQAAIKASAEDAKMVRPSHFEWAKERIMMGAARKSAYITPENKLATAYHEAGHALVAIYTKGAYPLQTITVIPRGNALGYTLLVPEMDRQSHSFTEYQAQLAVAMGGRVAEELCYGKENITDGASSDISNATSIANRMVRRFGYSDALGPVAHPGDAGEGPKESEETARVIDGEVRRLVEEAQARARELLKARKGELERLAKALVEFETLTASEVQTVIKGEKLERTGLE
ncbi:hypothetical protein JCM8547_004537 [Rhodosporidiobolus lusitaniae]